MTSSERSGDPQGFAALVFALKKQTLQKRVLQRLGVIFYPRTDDERLLSKHFQI